MADPLDGLRALLGDRLLTDPAVLAENASDFGRLLQAPPLAVARPGSTAETAAVVRWAGAAKVPLVARGKAHSQSGLSLGAGAVVLDLSGMASVGRPDPGTGDLEAGGGALWRDVAAAALAAGRIPPVLTNNLGVSVAGTLSVAGLGISSFRHGCQGDQVASLEVVTGAGDVVACSAEKERDLFDAVRSGLGTCGVITRATLRTVACLPRVRTYFLLYDDLPSLMKDARRLMEEGRFGYLEAWCVPCPQGFRKTDGVPVPFAQWFYPLHVSVEFRPGEAPDAVT